MGVKKARKLDEKNVMYEGMILSMEDFKKYLADEIIEAATEPTRRRGGGEFRPRKVESQGKA